MDILGPARSAAAAVVALFRGRAYVTSSGLRYDCGPVRPRLTRHGVIFCIAQSNN